MKNYAYRILVMSFDQITGEHIPFKNHEVDAAVMPGERVIKVFDNKPELIRAKRNEVWGVQVLLEREVPSRWEHAADVEELTSILKGERL